MALQYWTIRTFGGVNKNGQPSEIGGNQFRVCQNFEGRPDVSGTKDVGFLFKSPATANYKTTTGFTAGRTRGLFSFYPESTSTISWILAAQCVTDYSALTVFALDVANNTWKTLEDLLDPYHMDFEQYGNKVYMTNGDANRADGPYKWWHGSAAWETHLPPVRDKGGTATNIAGATLTWNLTNTVTSDIAVSALVLPGDWIRKSSASSYWDEVISVNTGGDGKTITLMEASSENGASGAGTAQKAPQAYNTIGRPLFLKSFKNKIWAANNLGNADYYSRLYWSVTADPEDWSSSGSGYLDIPNYQGDGTMIVGLGALDDYLFVFKDTKYYVYKWTGDLTTPIELIKTVNQGCVSERTIQDVGGALIYLVGNDVRMTNGNQDVSISDKQMRRYFEAPGVTINRMFSYYVKGAADNLYPWAIIDRNRHLYKLVFPSSTTNATCWNYDYKNGIWSNEENYYIAGHGALLEGAGVTPLQIIATSTSTNQLKQIYTYGGDLSTAGVLESMTLAAKDPAIKNKIAWVEFGFHPALGCDSDITFNYYKDYGLIDTSKAQPYNLVWSIATETNTDNLTIKRFPVNEICNYFSWYLSAADGGGTDSLGLVYVTVAYEPMSTS
jgi:hypothetical protein